MRHFLAYPLALSVKSHPVSMAAPPVSCPLQPPTCLSYLPTSSLPRALLRAVPVPPVAGTAEKKLALTKGTTTHNEFGKVQATAYAAVDLKKDSWDLREVMWLDPS